MKILICLFVLVLTSCTSLHSVSTSSIPAQRGKPVSAKSEKFIILGFNFSNEYIDHVVKDLARQCPNGKVQGILTKQESVNYFLYFFWTSRVSAQGYCVTNQVTANTKGRNPTSESESEVETP